MRQNILEDDASHEQPNPFTPQAPGSQICCHGTKEELQIAEIGLPGGLGRGRLIQEEGGGGSGDGGRSR